MPAGPSLLPEADHDPVDHDDEKIPDAAACQHPLGPVSRNEAIAGITPDDVAVEMGQQAFHLLYKSIASSFSQFQLSFFTGSAQKVKIYLYLVSQNRSFGKRFLLLCSLNPLET